MDVSSYPLSIKNNTLSRTNPWLVIILLLLLRFLLDGWLPFVTDVDRSWANPIYQIGTYILTAFFIWWKRDELSVYHIDKAAILFFLIFKPIGTLILPLWWDDRTSIFSFPHLPALSYWLVAAVLFLSIRKSIFRPSPSGDWKWNMLLIGAVVGVVWAVAAGFLLPPWTTPDQIVNTWDNRFLTLFPMQLGNGEELVFRGILWGQLRKAKWQELWICVFQAALFALAHGLYVIDPSQLPFAINGFFLGLVWGVLVWRSRSTATSMMSHSFYNASSTIFGMYIIGLL